FLLAYPLLTLYRDVNHGPIKNIPVPPTPYRRAVDSGIGKLGRGMANTAHAGHSGLNAAAGGPPRGIRARLLAMRRSHKRMLQVGTDAVLIWIALWLAFYLRLDNTALIEPVGGHAWLFVLVQIITIPVFVRLGLYRAVMRYVGSQALFNITL